MLNFTSQPFITINLFLQCLAGLLHSQLGCRGLQIHVIMAPSANQWCNLPHKPFHGDLRAVHCCCRSRCVISPLLVFALAKSHTRRVKFRDGCTGNLAARGNPSASPRALLHSAGQGTRTALTSG